MKGRTETSQKQKEALLNVTLEITEARLGNIKERLGTVETKIRECLEEMKVETISTPED
jgi:hypothetical protein